ncbi:cytochrome C biogenesis protein CcdA [Aphanothece hegewaldii CCALA 016]|uniref:Cytochrome C biogenesis protein CcdA n=1 Tax=Aphanothece hegewaldii CCALA 016 TaxID=2107694 RepID=A0A2T1M2E3_9CHRO|nr:cytochrome c biogenesis CcdA family protein [Aphanothece hegewaldii]PSF38925.1 cytochrome C biogenesis protein CcdA [Aphanothece hegewaldii CCALA 016]
MTTSTLSIGLAFLGGVLTVLSPCVLPILPLVVGRSLQSHLYGPVALVGGLIGGFAVAGSLLGIVATWFTGLINGLRTGAIVLLLVLGFLAIFPNWSYRLFSVLRVGKWFGKSTPVGLIGEFWIGTQLGLLWTPCAGPVLASILVLAAVNQQVISAFQLLVVYGIGAALPLLAIAYSSRVLGRRLLNLRSYSIVLQRLGGIIVVMTALAILMGWDVRLQLWLAPLFPPLAF